MGLQVAFLVLSGAFLIFATGLNSGLSDHYRILIVTKPAA